MRRLSAIACLLAVGVTATALAVEDRDLTGPIDPSGTVTVKIRFDKKHGVMWRTYRFKAEDVPLTCEEAGVITTDDIGGSITIRNDAPGRYEFGVGVVAQSKADYHWELDGKLVRHNRAEGIVRAGGSSWPLEGGGHDACHSGRLPWTATR